MSQYHRCIGGPMDGEMVAYPDHVKQFNATVPPERSFTLREPSDAPVTRDIKFVTYTLTRIADGSLIWQA